ncbi:1958_t:CDS:2, partial [Dentiscutata erythropus]
YDFEYVMTLSDWYHTPSGIILPLFRTPGYKGFEPVPDSGEISGLGQYDCNAAPKNSKCNPNNKVATYVVQKGKKYRFRIINMSTLSHFILSIDEHPFTVIATDSYLIKPVTLNTLPINIAQRYDIILNANKSIDNYQIRAKDNLPTSKAYPLNKTEECRDINVNILKPYYEKKVPRNIISKINLFVSFLFIPSSNLFFAQINNSSFVPTLNYPINQRIIQGVDPYKLPQYDNAYVYGCDSTKPADCKNAAVDIYITGENNTGTQLPDESRFNLIDPPYRDVVTIQPNATTVIRYFVDNPGVWLFHCHIQWHLDMGFAIQLIEEPSLFKNTTIPSEVTTLCLRTDNGNEYTKTK